MNFPMINTTATGQNINRMRIGAGMTVRDMQEVFGFTTPQALGVKFNRGSWSANDLANVAEFTGGVLNIKYPDGQEILIYPESKPKLRGKNAKAEE